MTLRAWWAYLGGFADLEGMGERPGKYLNAPIGPKQAGPLMAHLMAPTSKSIPNPNNQVPQKSG